MINFFCDNTSKIFIIKLVKIKLAKSKNKKLQFRSEALSSLNTPENLDTLIQVVTLKSWIILTAIYLLLGALLFWSFLGSIPTRVEGRGLLLVEDGTVYNAAAPPGGGRVVEILVKMGQVIRKGDSIAILNRLDLTEKQEVQEKYIERLKQEQKELIHRSETELAARNETIIKQREILDNTIKTEQENLKDIGKLLKFKDENFKKGLVVLQDIETTRRDYYVAKQKSEELYLELQKLKTQEADFKDQWKQRLKEKELVLLTEENELNEIKTDIEVAKTVVSPIDGTVIGINTSVGKMAASGDPIISLASLGQGLDALVFMTPQEGQKVTPGLQALVTPLTIEREEYGSMKGKVISVSAFPEAIDTMMAVLHNQELAKQFSSTGSPIAIRVRIEPDPSSYSGYRWTSSKGPPLKIHSGNLATVRITVREQTPISLLIPTLKKALGL